MYDIFAMCEKVRYTYARPLFFIHFLLCSVYFSFVFIFSPKDFSTTFRMVYVFFRFSFFTSKHTITRKSAQRQWKQNETSYILNYLYVNLRWVVLYPYSSFDHFLKWLFTIYFPPSLLFSSFHLIGIARKIKTGK